MSVPVIVIIVVMHEGWVDHFGKVVVPSVQYPKPHDGPHALSHILVNGVNRRQLEMTIYRIPVICFLRMASSNWPHSALNDAPS